MAKDARIFADLDCHCYRANGESQSPAAEFDADHLLKQIRWNDDKNSYFKNHPFGGENCKIVMGSSSYFDRQDSSNSDQSAPCTPAADKQLFFAHASCALPTIRAPLEALHHCSCDAAPSDMPDYCTQLQQHHQHDTALHGGKSCAWHQWIDRLVHEVRCEICTERLFCRACADVAVPRHNACTRGSVNCDSPPLSYEQLLERKREQNRAAARRYRCRKQRTMEREQGEIARLEARNGELRAERERLHYLIGEMKAQLARMGKAKAGVSGGRKRKKQKNE